MRLVGIKFIENGEFNAFHLVIHNQISHLINIVHHYLVQYKQPYLQVSVVSPLALQRILKHLRWAEQYPFLCRQIANRLISVLIFNFENFIIHGCI